MARSSTPWAWMVWAVLMLILIMAAGFRDNAVGVPVMLILFPFTGFLFIRGIIRWTGRQWRHDDTLVRKNSR
jgi:hypothetical protein